MRLSLAVGTRHLDGLAGAEHAHALEPGDLVLLEEELDALGVLGADRTRALHGDAVVQRDLLGRDAELLALRDLLRDGRGFEQRLGRDAAPEHAGAAEAFALDDADVEAELGAAEGGDVTGGAAAED